MSSSGVLLFPHPNMLRLFANWLKHSRLWLAAAIIALALLIGFAISVPHTARDTRQADASEAAKVPAVTLHDSYKKGTHTITGTVMAPNACSSASAQAFPTGDASDPSGIQVAVVLTTDTGICLQVPTRTAFSATVSAPGELPLSATVNGALATTTVS